MTGLCIKILVKADSAIESAFPWFPIRLAIRERRFRHHSPLPLEGAGERSETGLAALVPSPPVTNHQSLVTSHSKSTLQARWSRTSGG